MVKTKTSFMATLRESLIQPNLPGMPDANKSGADRIERPKFPENDAEARAQGYENLDDYLANQHLDSIAGELNEGADFDWVVSVLSNGERKAWLIPNATSEEDALAQWDKLTGGVYHGPRVEKIYWVKAEDLKEDHTNHQPEPTVTVVGEKDGKVETEIFDGSDENRAKEEFLSRHPEFTITKCELDEQAPAQNPDDSKTDDLFIQADNYEDELRDREGLQESAFKKIRVTSGSCASSMLGSLRESLNEGHPDMVEQKDEERVLKGWLNGSRDNISAIKDVNKALARYAVAKFLYDLYEKGPSPDAYKNKAFELGADDNALKRAEDWLDDADKARITGRVPDSYKTREQAEEEAKAKAEEDAKKKEEEERKRAEEEAKKGRFLYGWQFQAFGTLYFGHNRMNMEPEPGLVKKWASEVERALEADDPDMTPYLKERMKGVIKAGYVWRSGTSAYRFYAIFDHKLDDSEMSQLHSWIEGQASDGFGEGFEQRDIHVTTSNGKKAVLHVHMWVRNIDFWDGVYYINKGTDLKANPDKEPRF